jgi:hypothetical protein
MVMEHPISHNDGGEKEHSEKSLPSATVLTAHLTWTGPRLISHSIIHFSFYVAENTVFMHYKYQPVNAVCGNNWYIFLIHMIRTHAIGAKN